MQQQPGGRNTLVRENSLESILFQVEELQARVKRAIHILRRSAASRKYLASSIGTPNLFPRALPPANQRRTLSPQEVHRVGTLSTPPPKALSRGGPMSSSGAGSGRTGSGHARRKAADYDINNMITPQGLGTPHTFVEQARHADIETPQWRLIENAEQPDQESSSDEVGGALSLCSSSFVMGEQINFYLMCLVSCNNGCILLNQKLERAVCYSQTGKLFHFSKKPFLHFFNF